MRAAAAAAAAPAQLIWKALRGGYSSCARLPRHQPWPPSILRPSFALPPTLPHHSHVPQPRSPGSGGGSMSDGGEGREDPPGGSEALPSPAPQPEPVALREDQVQNAVAFLSHPKVGRADARSLPAASRAAVPPPLPALAPPRVTPGSFHAGAGQRRLLQARVPAAQGPDRGGDRGGLPPRARSSGSRARTSRRARATGGPPLHAAAPAARAACAAAGSEWPGGAAGGSRGAAPGGHTGAAGRALDAGGC